MNNRKYYAEISDWGRDKPTVLVFNSKKERDDFLFKNPYTCKLYAWEIKDKKLHPITLTEFLKGELSK